MQGSKEGKEGIKGRNEGRKDMEGGSGTRHDDHPLLTDYYYQAILVHLPIILWHAYNKAKEVSWWRPCPAITAVY
jgi:hypothetical protein